MNILCSGLLKHRISPQISLSVYFTGNNDPEIVCSTTGLSDFGKEIYDKWFIQSHHNPPFLISYSPIYHSRNLNSRLALVCVSLLILRFEFCIFFLALVRLHYYGTFQWLFIYFLDVISQFDAIRHGRLETKSTGCC